MTNSRLTDPEVLELRYPVLLERFEIVRGSGGKGEWRAGDGTLRVIRFLERMECAILSGFRKMRPFGVNGGEPGQAGENWVRRKNGTLERLKGSDQTVLEPAKRSSSRRRPAGVSAISANSRLEQKGRGTEIPRPRWLLPLYSKLVRRDVSSL